MSQQRTDPVVIALEGSFCAPSAFHQLSKLPGLLWLDSASRPGELADSPDLGRYSFLTADPVQSLVASLGDPNPWPLLSEWNDRLQELRFHVDGLPPFQGGIAGVIGYESGSWLEEIGTAAEIDLPTPALSLGVYDWTIAIDHQTDQAWIISSGIERDWTCCAKKARDRVDYVRSMVAGCVRSNQTKSASVDSEDVDELYQSFVTSNFTSQQFQAAVAEIVRRIHNGDSFQVNLAQRLMRKAEQSAPELYIKLREANPAPFGGFYDGGSFRALSSSPEGFLNVNAGIVQTRPIKGTIHRSTDAAEDSQLAYQLKNSAKDRAENVMIVDLMRNDLSRVCEDGSVIVNKLCGIESYQYVHHLVSVVEGKLRPDQSMVDLLMACFPGGSVTGAPKIEAMRTIAELEPNPRGPYCGSMGYISRNGCSDWNILIRTITETDGFWLIPVGGGITARSEPVAEEAETWAKAKGMLRALQ